MDGLGLYVHIPFCQSRCLYCDFNTYAGLEGLFEGYVRALIQEMALVGPVRVRTIYIGGGTPTVLPLSHLAQILDAVHSTFVLEKDAEITIEANPGTVDAGTLAHLRERGVNRLSLGVQSFLDDELRLLGRIHTADQAAAAVEAARRAGFENVGLDLIYGLPGQATTAWQFSLDRALALQPQHLSLYALSVEVGTPLAAAIARGHLPAPDPDLAAEMYEMATEINAAAGYRHYEISNWARTEGHCCRHNLIYWRNEPYLGLGAGAHSWRGGRRWANVTAPDEYAARLQHGGTAMDREEQISPELEMGEMMMMGLRLVEEGVPWERFRRHFDLEARQRFEPQIAELVELGLLEADAERARLSPRGRLLGNRVFGLFLP
jgi:oxygen-independent coproporphyrinogen-3 oxidase